MTATIRRAGSILALIVTMNATSAFGLSIREFRKHPPEQQAVYVSAAVSMVAYTYAANGDSARARCVMDWYFGRPGEETRGPHQLAVEVELAARRDADGFQIEGVVLGVVERECKLNAPERK